MSNHGERRSPSPRARAVAVLLAVQLLAGLVATIAFRARHESAPAADSVLGRVAPAAAADAAREGAVRTLLALRATAIRGRDREAWLSTIDPAAGPFRQRQADLFDAIAAVPLSDWTYRLDPQSEPPATVDLDARRGTGWWAPGVTLSYRIAGYDEVPTLEPQRLTFVPRGERWYVAADDDFAAAGRGTARGLWDSGPVVVVRGAHCIVLGHARSRSLMRRVATSIDAAVPRVTNVWGTGWSRLVVALVPSSQDELLRIVGGTGDYSQIAAVATAELTGGAAGYHPVGDRIVINPLNFAKLGAIGRRVVVTHEVTHVATRASTGPQAPAWLVEGFADYLGYRGVRVSYRLAAAELGDAVRHGRGPRELPSDRDFRGGNTDLAQVYEQAWLAVRLLAETYGREKLLAFYRQVGRPDAPATVVEDALAGMFGTDLDSFTRAWRRDLATRLR